MLVLLAVGGQQAWGWYQGQQNTKAATAYLALTGPIDKSSGVLQLGGGLGNIAVYGVISGADPDILGPGTTTYYTQMTYSGATNIYSGGTLKNGVPNALPSTTTVTVGSGSTGGTYDLNGNVQTVAGISTAGNGTPQTITNTAGTGATLTVSPTGSDNDPYAGLVSGNLGLVKAAGGALILSNPNGNTYYGGTTVNGGALYANNNSLLTGSATGSGNVVVNAGGILAGNGTINVGAGNMVSVNSGGTVYPGYNKGTVEALTVNMITFDSGSNLNIDVASTYHDYLQVTGPTGLDLTNIALNLSLAGGDGHYITLVNETSGSLGGTNLFNSLFVNGTPIVTGGGVANNTEFMDVGGTITTASAYTAAGDWSNPGVLAETTFWWLQYNVNPDTGQPGGNDAVLTNVPEPSTIVMLVGAAAMGLGGLAWRKKRRRAV